MYTCSLRSNPTPVKNKPFIVCGPFGVGKKTLRTRVLEKYGDLFAFCTSHTTRAQKAGEDENSYHFVTTEAFEKMKKEGKFIETCENWGHQYGTSNQEIEKIKADGKIPYLEVDFTGANGLKSIAANFVFLYPPGIEELRRRIANRTEDTEELFKKRMELAIKEIEMANNAVLFTNRIINDELEKADQQLCTLIEALYFQELKDRRGEDYEQPSAVAQTQAISESKNEVKEDILELREESNDEKAKDAQYDIKELKEDQADQNTESAKADSHPATDEKAADVTKSVETIKREEPTQQSEVSKSIAESTTKVE
jgi:guanylate kinase